VIDGRFADLSADLDRVVRRGGRCTFLSPHLDDAVLSCGSLMAGLAGHCEIVVATVFTDSGPPPHTRAARSYLRQCAWAEADRLYAARRAEDIQVLDRLGARHVHLGEPDALFRMRRHACSGPWRRIPELVHRYPTYRFDIARGHIARADRSLVEKTAERLRELTADDSMFFVPLGVGRHVDHLITRAAGTRLGGRVLFYADFPYNRSHPVDQRFVARHNLTPATWRADAPDKEPLIRGYASQVEALFPGAVIPRVAETYYRR